MAGEMLWSTQSGYLTNNKLNMTFQKQAQPMTRFRQFVSIKEAFGKQQGQTVNWLQVSNLNTLGGQLTETRTMHETKQPLAWGTLTVQEYGNSIPYTLKLEALSEFEVEQIMREGLLDDAVKVLDAGVEAQFGATKLYYVGTATGGSAFTTNGTATATNTSVLNSYHMRKMILKLKQRNVPGYTKLGGDYSAILSLEAMESLVGAVESVNQYTESGYRKILNGEVARWYGCRLVEDAWASRNTISLTNRTSSAISWTKGSSGPGYVFGSPTVREAVVIPEEVRMKVTTDYGRSKGIGWYFLGGWVIEWGTEPHARIVKWASKA